MLGKTKILLITLITMMLCAGNIWALPARVIIIRHAEKPKNSEELNTRGWERAGALPPYFKTFNTQNPIVAVYATRPDKKDHPSLRPEETCQPTATALDVPFHVDFTAKEYAKMAQQIKTDPAYDNKTVLICWQHELIPAIAESLGVKNPPRPWPSHIFDATWVITYEKNSLAQLSIQPQRLLFGDSPTIRNMEAP